MDQPDFGMMLNLRRVLSRTTDILADDFDLLTFPQIVVLRAIVSCKEIPSQTDIVNLTGIDRSTTADIVNRLQQKRFIRRARSPADKRAYQLRLTNEGKDALAAAEPFVKRIEEEFLGQLTNHQTTIFLGALQTLATVDVSTTRQTEKQAA